MIRYKTPLIDEDTIDDQQETELAIDTESEDVMKDPISERDTMVLKAIGEESLTAFTFDGLKRKLGVHPETLSRALKRLEEQGIVERTLEGYRVTPETEKLLKINQISMEEPSVPILQTRLPNDVPPQEVIPNLMGRWFGVLRWLGYSQNEDGITLKWITEDGRIQVNANFSAGDLDVEAKIKEEKDLSGAIRASHQLMGYIAKLYSRLGQTGRIVYLELFEPYTIPACK
ncbi:MAG: hypothetical protein H3Z50_07060 [archaeon]|nr:hypothetical protein [archaeon]MCP8306722.1 hypothetical protein [archaeon]